SGTRNPDYLDSSITQNIRVSYPIEHIPGVWQKDVAGAPKDIFFLTCDAFGVLPPISRLSKEQAMYYFLAGYTAKVAGTEEGVEEPQATFSACFGAPFLPLPHTTYAKMLGEKIDQNDTRVWLVNTGWVGGSYGTGKRISLKYTRSMITAAMNGELDAVDYETHPIFGLEMPAACPNVPVEVLSPVKTWADADAYTHKAQDLANQIEENFQPYAEAMAQVKRVPVKV
ncbi:MAG: phosphoenolpyruvate carboxykinase (ATP), partial [Bacteroidota bacterium]